jgi:GAF domain-containing protein
MTPGERAIYAATYALAYDRAIQNPPDRVTRPDAPADAWEEWETDHAVSAAEQAAHAVAKFRLLARPIRDGYGATSEVARMYRTARGKKR